MYRGRLYVMSTFHTFPYVKLLPYVILRMPIEYVSHVWQRIDAHTYYMCTIQNVQISSGGWVRMRIRKGAAKGRRPSFPRTTPQNREAGCDAEPPTMVFNGVRLRAYHWATTQVAIPSCPSQPRNQPCKSRFCNVRSSIRWSQRVHMKILVRTSVTVLLELQPFSNIRTRQWFFQNSFKFKCQSHVMHRLPCISTRVRMHRYPSQSANSVGLSFLKKLRKFKFELAVSQVRTLRVQLQSTCHVYGGRTDCHHRIFSARGRPPFSARSRPPLFTWLTFFFF